MPAGRIMRCVNDNPAQAAFSDFSAPAAERIASILASSGQLKQASAAFFK